MSPPPAPPRFDREERAHQLALNTLAPLRGEVLVREWLQAHPETLQLPSKGRLFVIALGKAAVSMAKGWPQPLPAERLCITKHGLGEALEGWSVHEAGHPIPDAASEKAGQLLRDFAARMTSKDRWVLLLSGGASALVLSPREGIAPERLKSLTDALLSQEVSIEQLNTVRQHCSTFKGGGWLSMTPCDGVTLAISDVEHALPAIVGSGPSVVPETTAEDAIRILQKRNLDSLFKDIVAILQKETPLTSPVSSSPWISLADNQSWLDALQESLRRSGYDSDVFPEALSQPMPVVISTVTRHVRQALENGDTGWLLFGGEPVCELPETSFRGVGGRMQHLALALAWEWRKESWPYTLLAAASDGSDGPTSAAGALLCRQRVESCDEKDWAEALARWDSTAWHSRMKSLWKTGGTGTNVRDVLLIDLSVQS